MLRCGTVLIMFGQAVKLIGFEGENTIEPGPAVYCRCPWYRFRGAARPRVLTSWSVLAFARRSLLQQLRRRGPEGRHYGADGAEPVT